MELLRLIEPVAVALVLVRPVTVVRDERHGRPAGRRESAVQVDVEVRP